VSGRTQRPVYAEHEIEPTPGLPARLPAGENLLWQGSPEPAGLTRRALGLRGIALYFGAMLCLQAGLGLNAGQDIGSMGFGLAVSATIGLVGLGLLYAIGRASARAAMFTITDKRVVMRVGIALPMTINIPFTVIEGLARKVHSDGTEDLVLTILKPARLSYIMLWPHLRVGHVLTPKPMLRALPQSQGVAQLLARALAASAGQAAPSIAEAEQPGARPSSAAALV